MKPEVGAANKLACLHLEPESHLIIKTNQVHSCLWFNLCFSRVWLCSTWNLNYKWFGAAYSRKRQPCHLLLWTSTIKTTLWHHDYLMASWLVYDIMTTLWYHDYLMTSWLPYDNLACIMLMFWFCNLIPPHIFMSNTFGNPPIPEL